MTHTSRTRMQAIGTMVAVLASVAALGAAPGDLDPFFGIPPIGSGGRVAHRFGETDPGWPFARALAIQPDGKIVVVGEALMVDPRHPDIPDDDVTVSVGAIVRYQPDGSLDPTFGGGDGVVLTPARATEDSDFHTWKASAVVLQPDGKIVVAGGGGFGNSSGAIVARYNADGRLDPTFARFTDNDFHAVEVYPGYQDAQTQLGAGMLVVGGDFCREIDGLALLPDGKIIMGGCAGSFARLNPNGTPDLTFGPVGHARTFLVPFGADNPGAFAIQSDGKIVAAGPTNTANFTLARATPNGERDLAFGGGNGHVFTELGLRVCVPGFPCEPNGGPRAVMIQPDGKIVVAGTALVDASFPGRNGLGLARYNPDGSLNASFGIGGTVTTDFGFWAEGLAGALHADGRIVVAGFGIDNSTGVQRFLVARYNANGSLDDSFGVNGSVLTDFTGLVPTGSPSSSAAALALQSDGKIVAAGSADAGDGVAPATATYFALARYVGGGAAGGNTPAGPAVVQLQAVTLTFQNVTVAGETTVTTSITGPAPPSGFQSGEPPTYFDINTTAVFSGQVEVCISYASIAFDNEANLKIMHFEPPDWVDRTVSLDTTNDVICAEVTSLSPFAVFESIDTTPPIIAASVSPEPNGVGWHNSDPTIVWSVTDPESGVASSTGCETRTLTVETSGTTLTCSATNGAGLAASAAVTLMIDKTPPLLTCSATPDRLWPPNHNLIDVATVVTVNDPLSGSAGFVLRSAASSEPDDGLGHGDVASDVQDWEIGAPDTVGRLRAERSGAGNGRQYSLLYDGRDRADNVASCTAAVLVPHDLGP